MDISVPVAMLEIHEADVKSLHPQALRHAPFDGPNSLPNLRLLERVKIEKQRDVAARGDYSMAERHWFAVRQSQGMFRE